MYTIDYSLNNGIGNDHPTGALSIYYSGCDIPVKCKECHNPELWAPQDPRMTYKEVKHRLEQLKRLGVDKDPQIAFVGGDPMAPYNRESTIEVAAQLKKDFPDTKLVLYSWRTLEELEEQWTVSFDYGVLGQFDIGEFRQGWLPASSNQYIWDFKKQEQLKPIKLK